MVADFRREYGMSCDDLGRIGLSEFMWLLEGLSDKSRFRVELSEKPKTLHDPAERAALVAAARR